MKLVRLIAKHRSLGRTAALRAIAAGRAFVNGSAETDAGREIDRFAAVSLDGDSVQTGARALHLMLHKPAGVVSATTDPEHTTVIDLIHDPDKHTLHIAGRLDRSTTGLVLLTNDGRWSKRITEKTFQLPKTYLVETRDPFLPKPSKPSPAVSISTPRTSRLFPPISKSSRPTSRGSPSARAATIR